MTCIIRCLVASPRRVTTFNTLRIVLEIVDGERKMCIRDRLSAGPSSTLVLNRFAFNSATHAGAVDATVRRGTLAVVSGKIAKASPESVSFKTPSVSLGVRGTEFIVEVGQGDEQ